MRIEQITKQNLSEAPDKELISLRWNFIKLWDKHFKGNDYEIVGCFKRDAFIADYRLLLKELDNRTLEHSTCDVDRQAFKKAMEVKKIGLDVSQLTNIPVMKAFIYTSTDISKLEKINLTVRGELDETTEKHILKQIEEQTGKECAITQDMSYTGKCISLYDNVLVPVEKMEEVEIEKQKEQTEQSEQKLFEKDISIIPIEKGDEHVVYGIVYEPDVEDSQGDKANEDEIRKAAYQFMEQVQIFKVNHKGRNVKVRVLENYIAPVDFAISGGQVKKGSWILVTRVLDDKIWKAIKDGKLTGYSMAGYAQAVN